MLKIRNLDLITSKVHDFSMLDLHFITSFHYTVAIDTVALFDVHNKSTLVIDFVLVPKDRHATYKVTIRFYTLGSLNLSTDGKVIQLSGFEILDIADRGWESITYQVRDFEKEEDFMFYCNKIEVVSIEEVHWII
ncbi:hypothetical protein SK066_13835 [Paenibacillus hunanensis]|uniref:hypothetical protein n=1 Tax=Paenibacillus hunanensis TaxID=539262 RepID=UPI002A6A9D33|nr:hypothetical protein [Paenibacillus hunanensis]WPP39704.1 hypothetical protein SK066_13835 [Paenibacillus hunanensis]